MAWLAEVIPQLEGSGIVYVKIVRDCDLLADWLNRNGIKSAGYHGGTKGENETFKDEARIRLEQALLSNHIKVLVATSALGMGFDKPDLGFVIHFQLPGSIVEYYQQVGRAGRGIDHAYGMLMNGAESEEIQSYFIQNAFPKEEEIKQVLDAIEKNGGLRLSEIEPRTNLRSSRIQAVLKFLSVESPSPIYKDDKNKYFRNEQNYSLPYDRIARVSQIKEDEWKQ
ncbi:helicase-related protein, partial [Acinetobacter baumannii]|nr:helicase-related protein [Acinetobacter baumannii]